MDFWKSTKINTQPEELYPALKFLFDNYDEDSGRKLWFMNVSTNKAFDDEMFLIYTKLY